MPYENAVLNYDLAVIGGGPAGMAAALRAKELGVEKIVILERAECLGGILEQCIHTGFGLSYFGEELSGPEYADRFIQQVNKTDIDVRLNTMVLDIDADKTVTATSADGGLIKIKAKAIVLAMGCRERPRGALQMAGPRVSGVMTAGTAQKYVNIDGYMPGKKVVILGSGDIGLIMARRMTLEGAEVKVVCEIMPFSGGLTRNILQCLKDFDIPLRLSTTVIETHGKDRLEGVTIAAVDERLEPIPGTEEYIECDLLLLSVGLIPENELTTSAGIPIDRATRGAYVNEMRETAMEGVFACGNVLQVHDLVDFVTLESQLAGEGAANYILGKEGEKAYCETKAGNGVAYIVPQRVNTKSADDVKLYFRVRKTFTDSKICVEADGKELLRPKKHIKLAPGEMESVTLTPEILATLGTDSVITVRVEE